MDTNLSYNAKNALKKAIIMAAITAIAYLIVVVITTPSLPPESALKAAFAINSMVIIGISVGVGAQIFISSYGKSMGCRLDKKKKGVFGVGSGSTAVSSFFSFFSLVPLGSCGTWLLVLSYLPSLFGGTLSVALVQYSRPLSYVGLAIVFGFAALSAHKLDTELKLRQQIQDTKVINDRINGKSLALFSLHPFIVRVFNSTLDGQKMDFQYSKNTTKITDKQTGSEWNFDGTGIAGPMIGKHLIRLPFDEGFWFEWVAFHPKSALYPG